MLKRIKKDSKIIDHSESWKNWPEKNFHKCVFSQNSRLWNFRFWPDSPYSLLHIDPIQENLHFSCLVHGSDLDELQRVKKILSFLLVAGMQQFSEQSLVSALEQNFPGEVQKKEKEKMQFSCSCETAMKNFSFGWAS